MWLTIAFVVMLSAVLVAVLIQRQRGGNPGTMSANKAAQYAQGSLTVTGVSERPDQGDKNDQVYCTISGTILGDQTAPTEVYGTVVLSLNDPWPQIGSDLPVIYKPGKADSSWQIGQLPDPGPGPMDGPPPSG